MPFKEERSTRLGLQRPEAPAPRRRRSEKPARFRKDGKKNKKSESSKDSEKPTDMYYMLTVNWKYEERIHNLLEETNHM